MEPESSEEKIDLILKGADENGDGKVSFDEFKKILQYQAPATAAL